MHSETVRDHDVDRMPDGCPAALAVPCPICIALAGEQCMPMSLTAPHWARVQLALGGGR